MYNSIPSTHFRYNLAIVKKERIAKVLARAGVASRRDAERMIEAGRVSLNGAIVSQPGTLADADDVLAVDGEPIRAREPTRLWRYHKLAGLVTTARDPQGRPTVFEKLPKDLPRVISVGRLDINTEGLLLLTNDGALARYLEHPAQALSRTYRVRAYGRADRGALARISKGVTIDGVRYRPVEVTLDRQQSDNCWLTMVLREGKNREIKRMLESINLQVSRLIRTGYGPFQLDKLPPGEAEPVPPKVLARLLPDYFTLKSSYCAM